MAKPLYKEYDAVVQDPCCCVPAVLEMIFNRHSLPFPGQLKAAKRLGLVVPYDMVREFRHPVAVVRYPAKGIGTRIDIPRYSLQSAFRDWGVPLAVRFKFTNQIENTLALEAALRKTLRDENEDCILCVRSGALEGDPDRYNGHAILLSGIKGKTLSYIDPHDGGEYESNTGKLFKALNHPKQYGGLWLISQASLSS